MKGGAGVLSIFRCRIPKAVLCFLCTLLMLSISIAFPIMQARAVLVVDDLAIAGIMALLAAWGIDLVATISVTNTNISSSMQDLLSASGVAVDLTADAMTIPSTGIMGIPKSIYNAARSVANYVKINYFNGTNSGTTPLGSSLCFSSLSFNYDGGVISYAPVSGVLYSLYYDTDWGSPSVLAFSASPNVTIIENWKGSPEQCYLATPVTVNNQDFYYYSYSLGYTGTLPHSNISSIIASTLNPSLSISAEEAAIPSSDTDDDKYVAVPGANWTTLTGAKDYWFDRAKDDAASRTAPVEADSEQDAENALEEAPYVPSVSPVSGLATVFPFCIPFDIYNFLSVFQATRQAPSVTLPLAFPAAIGGTRNMTIDLSGFDTVATVLRTCELIAFCIGLAAATWKYIKW